MNVRSVDSELTTKFSLQLYRFMLLMASLLTVSYTLCSLHNCHLQIVVLHMEKAKAAIPDIFTTQCIPSAMSDDLKA
ncbi:hypothetical protein ACET3Z_011391 [Daucus carota]